jgi:hypothetical protein
MIKTAVSRVAATAVFLISRAALASILALLFLAESAFAARVSDEEFLKRRGLNERWKIGLGGYLKRFDTVVRFGSSDLGLGGAINLEDIFGLDAERIDLVVEGSYNFNRRHKIQFGYSRWKRFSTEVTETEIDLDGDTIAAGAIVETTFNSGFFDLAYKYSFINNGRVDFGFTAGINTYVYELGIRATGSVSGGGGVIEGDGIEEADVIAPIPMLGLELETTILPKFFFRATGQVFDISYGDLDARVTNYHVSFDYYPFKIAGFGIGYRGVDTRIFEDGIPAWEITYDFSGVTGYVSFIWGKLPPVKQR